jgi:phage terminase small subunit
MSWADAYGIDEETHPGDYDILQQLAVERVRSERSADYLLDESETQDSPVFDGQGNLVEREDVSNTLTEVHQRQRKLILKMMKELGITPKARSRMDKEEADTNASEALASIASDALSSDKGEYNPEKYEEE